MMITGLTGMTALAGAAGTALLAVEKRDVDPGVLGFVVVALLGLATYLLIRSMNRRIRHIDLPGDEASSEGSASGAPDPR